MMDKGISPQDAPVVRKMLKRIEKACDGATPNQITQAVLAYYTGVLLINSADLAQFNRNVALGVSMLDANAKMHFKAHDA